MVVESKVKQQKSGERFQSKERPPQITLLADRAVQIVIVDTDPSYIAESKKLLAADNQFECHGAESLEDLMALIERVDLDCAIISADVGDANAFGIREKLVMACPSPPAAIMMVRESSERNAIKAFRSGFVDYLKKTTLDASGLRSAVIKAANLRRDRLRERDQIQALSDMAMRDSLTGLSNRNALEDHLSMMMESGLRHGKPFAVVLIDIDHFKHINDTFGHFIGDHALKEFAKKLKQSARNSDTYGRLGGDEFLYLIGDGVSVESIRSACDRLSKSLTFTIDLENLGFAVHASIGAAIYPIDGKTVPDMLKAADGAMYRAKTSRSGTCLALELQSPGSEPESAAPDRPIASGTAAEPVSSLEADATRSDDGAAPDADETTPDAPASAVDAPYSAHRLGNRRIEQRHRVLKKATVYSNDGLFSIDCVVRDLSSGGARITVAGEFCIVPDNLTLLITQTGEKFTAEKRWQRGGDVGLMFSGSAPRPMAPTPVRPHAVEKSPPTMSPQQKPTPRAFVIDDDPQICEVVARALAGRGYIASEFATLKEVEAALALVRPDLIVLDLSLGETDAIEVMKRIAATRFSGHILLISGHDIMTLGEVHKIGARGGHHMLPVLQKPFRLKEFRERLDAMETPSASSDADDLLELALQKGWLEVWYQPKIDLRSMAVCGSEALARIRHPDRGVLLPSEFLPPSTNTINRRFTEFVLQTALRDWRTIAAQSTDNGSAVHRIAINVAASCILAPGFIEFVRSVLPNDPNFPGFVIEITENETIADPEALREIAVQLRLNNIVMSIDDFGSGQSTIGRLVQLPFNEIKLDRSYVHGCSADKSRRAACQYVLDLAHDAGMLALAEGIESAEDLEVVIDMGFDLAQGFVFAKAMIRDDLIEMLGALQHGSEVE